VRRVAAERSGYRAGYLPLGRQNQERRVRWRRPPRSVRPEPMLDRLSAEVMKILNEPEVLEKLKGLAFVPAKESRQDFEAYIAIEDANWRKIVQDAGVKIE
jgi:hypothetical protein